MLEENYQLYGLYQQLKNQLIISGTGQIIDVDIKAIISYLNYCGINDDNILDKLIHLGRTVIIARKDKEDNS